MTTTAPRPASPAIEGPGVRPLLDGQRTTGEQLLVKVFVIVPLLALLALLAAVPLAWGWGLSWTDIGLAMFFYFLSGLGTTGCVQPPLHPPRVQDHPGAEDRAGHRRQHA